MEINVFKDGLFEKLKQYNHEIVEVCDRHIINKFGDGNKDGNSCWWFDPRGQQKLHLTSSWRKYGQIVFPEPNPIVYEPRFCLVMFCPNYATLWIINKLFKFTVLMKSMG